MQLKLSRACRSGTNSFRLVVPQLHVSPVSSVSRSCTDIYSQITKVEKLFVCIHVFLCVCEESCATGVFANFFCCVGWSYQSDKPACECARQCTAISVVLDSTQRISGLKIWFWYRELSYYRITLCINSIPLRTYLQCELIICDYYCINAESYCIDAESYCILLSNNSP